MIELRYPQDATSSCLQATLHECRFPVASFTTSCPVLWEFAVQLLAESESRPTSRRDKFRQKSNKSNSATSRLESMLQCDRIEDILLKICLHCFAQSALLPELHCSQLPKSCYTPTLRT